MNSLKDCFLLRNGVEIPCVGFGTWQTPDGAVAAQSVREAIACGYRHIDTAAAYGNEESVGLGIRESGVPRAELFVTTKLWNSEHGYDSTLKAFDLSMRKLGLDYCDLYLIHWPNPPMFRDCWQEKNSETWKAMEKLYNEGRIRAIGISNFLPHHIEALLKTATILPMVNQMCLHPAQSQPELVEYCQKLGILLEAYSPLGTGSLLQQPEILACAEKYKKPRPRFSFAGACKRDFCRFPSPSLPRASAKTRKSSILRWTGGMFWPLANWRNAFPPPGIPIRQISKNNAGEPFGSPVRALTKSML